MRKEITQRPVNKPVSIEEVKAVLRLSQNNQDGFIDSLIDVANESAEAYTGKFLINTSVAYYYNKTEVCTIIDLSTNINAISAVKIYDINDVEIIVDPSKYKLVGRNIIFESGLFAGYSLRNKEALKVEFVAGFGENSSDLPSIIRMALKNIASDLFKGNEEGEGRHSLRLLSPYVEAYKWA